MIEDKRMKSQMKRNFILFPTHEATIRTAVLLLLLAPYIPGGCYIIIKKTRKIYVKSQET